MSRIGKIPVEVPKEASVNIDGSSVLVKGPKGELAFDVPSGIKVKFEEDKIIVSQDEKSKELTSALFGLTRAMIANMVKGVTTGFEKKLELSGVGFRAQATPEELTLSLGFSHPVKVKAPKGITFAVKDNAISVMGIDVALVGNTAAQIRAIKSPEPYKGKGIKYAGEKIRIKAGKAKATAGAAGGK